MIASRYAPAFFRSASSVSLAFLKSGHWETLIHCTHRTDQIDHIISPFDDLDRLEQIYPQSGSLLCDRVGRIQDTDDLLTVVLHCTVPGTPLRHLYFRCVGSVVVPGCWTSCSTSCCNTRHFAAYLVVTIPGSHYTW